MTPVGRILKVKLHSLLNVGMLGNDGYVKGHWSHDPSTLVVVKVFIVIVVGVFVVAVVGVTTIII